MPGHHSGDSPGGVHIYTMNNVKDVAMYPARNQLYRDGYSLLRQTLRDCTRSVDANVTRH